MQTEEEIFNQKLRFQITGMNERYICANLTSNINFDLINFPGVQSTLNSNPAYAGWT
jgi:hypothetical protein